MYHHDTYDRRIQIGASRRRKEDAEALYNAGRWAGAIYMAGYAIECSLCSLVCVYEDKNNFKDTVAYKDGTKGATMHNLVHLLSKLPSIQRAIMLDRTEKYKEAWTVITSLWQKDELRYWDKVGEEINSGRFIASVALLHRFILEKQGAIS